MEVGKEGSNDREVCRQVLAPADALGAGSETGRQGTDLVPDVHGFCNIHLGRHELRYGFLVCIVPNETHCRVRWGRGNCRYGARIYGMCRPWAPGAIRGRW